MQNAPFRSPGGQVFSRGVPLGHMRYYIKYYINLLCIYIYIYTYGIDTWYSYTFYYITYVYVYIYIWVCLNRSCEQCSKSRRNS